MKESKRLVAYQSSVEVVRRRLLKQVLTVWAGLPSYRDADVDSFVAWAVPRVQAGQLHIANLTASYFEAGEVDAVQVLTSRGVAAEVVYRRPAVTVYTELTKGATFTKALDIGRDRLMDLVSTDLQLAKTHQSRHSLSSKGVTHYRRVLTGRENCALCVIASTQRYHKSDLMPIHPGCDCTVDELPRGWDPDQQVINEELLTETHAEIDKRLGLSDPGARDLGLGKVSSKGKPISDYTDLVVTRQHGEYGPTLSWRDQKFTSEADIAALN